MNSLVQWLIVNLVLASLIGALALAIGRGGRRAPLAHLLWLMVFIKLVTPPLLTVPLPIPDVAINRCFAAQTDVAALPNRSHLVAERDEPSGDAMQNANVLPDGSLRSAIDHPSSGNGVIGNVVPNRTGSTGSPTWWNIATTVGLLVWLVGFAVILTRGLKRLLRLRSLIDDVGIHDEDATQLVQLILRQRGIVRRRAPSVVRLPVRVSPMLFCFGQSVLIVCPDELWESLELNDRRAFLAHEAAHFARRDHWVRWVEWIVSAAYWWFPLVYFAQRQLERHEEACCDAWAVRTLEQKPRAYAEALLRVVDFVSEKSVALPRLASGMHPTATLEERLRLLMRPHASQNPSTLHYCVSGLACLTIWMVHPQAYRWEMVGGSSSLISTELSTADVEVVAASKRDAIVSSRSLIDSGQPESQRWSTSSLPESPEGFWTSSPNRKWAGFEFGISGFDLQAIAGRGVLIRHAALDAPLVFANGEMTCIAGLQQDGRVVIGDSAGNVRLWDLQTGQAISLLGRHATGVTSVTVTSDGAVFSADEAGSVIRWERQSGQVLAQWSPPRSPPDATGARRAISSIRCSIDGRHIAVLQGDWRTARPSQNVYFLDAKTLETKTSLSTMGLTAVVVESPSQGWLALGWNGVVRSLASQTITGKVEKHQVSALLLSQHAPLDPETVAP